MKRGLAAALWICLAVVLAAPAGAGPAGATQWLLVVDQGAGSLLLVDPDGTAEPVPIGPLTAGRGVSVSPDGARAAVVDAGAAAGEGRILVVVPDGATTVAADGLEFPEDVAWLDDSTLVFTSFTTGEVLTVPAAGGTPEVLATLPQSPSGVETLVIRGRDAVAVSTWQGPVVVIDPATGAVEPATENLAGGGQLAAHPELGVCAPEFEADQVRCWTIDGVPFVAGSVPAPVALDWMRRRLVVTGGDGVVVLDPETGEVTPIPADLVNPSGISVITDPVPWGGAPAPVVTTTSTTVAETTSSTVVETTAPPVPLPTAAPGTTVPAPAAEGGGFPWWLALVGLVVAVVALILIFVRRWSRPPSTPATPISVPTAVKAAEDCDEDRFWAAYWASEEYLISLQELILFALDLGDRAEVARLRKQHDEVAEQLERARQRFLEHCPKRERREPEPVDGWSVDPIPGPCARLAALQAAHERLLEHLAEREREIADRLAEIERAEQRVREARERAEEDAAHASDELDEAEARERRLREAALRSDEELAAEWEQRNAERIESARRALEDAERSYREWVDTYGRQTPGTPEHAAARANMLEAQRRYFEARSAHQAANPPGEEGMRSKAAERRAEIERQAEGAAGERSAADADRWDAERRRARADERLAELERERAALEEERAGIPERRRESEEAIEEAERKCRKAREDEEEHRRRLAAIAAAEPEGEPEIAKQPCFMFIYIDTTGLPHVAIGFKGPGIDRVYSLGGSRDYIGGSTADYWPASPGPADEKYTNAFYEQDSANRNQPIYVLPVEIPCEKMWECLRRLEAFVKTNPTSDPTRAHWYFGVVPFFGGSSTMCPNTWVIVRSVFASDWWSWGSTWFGGNSVIDDAIGIFYPDLSSWGPDVGFGNWITDGLMP